MQLLSLDELKLKELIDKNQLLPFTIGVVRNQAFQKNSSFAKNYKKFSYEELGDITEDLNHVIDKKEFNKSINKEHWYDAVLFEMYTKLGSMRAVSLKTKIPLRSVYNSISKTKKNIKNDLF